MAGTVCEKLWLNSEDENGSPGSHREIIKVGPDGVMLSAVNTVNVLWEENQVTLWNPSRECQVILKFQKATYKWKNWFLE